MGRIRTVDFDSYIINVKNAILGDEVIRKLLYYDTPDALQREDINPLLLIESGENGSRHLYTQPFTQPNVTESKNSYIEVFIANSRFIQAQTMQDIDICICVYTQIDTWNLDSGIRVHKIMDRLDDLFGYGDKIAGIGKSIGVNKRLARSSPKFQGYECVYRIIAFS